MFIYTQDEALVELSGSVRADEAASYNGKYRVIVTRRGCTTTLAEYDTREEARNCILLISIFLENGKAVCPLGSGGMDSETFCKILDINKIKGLEYNSKYDEDTEFWK